MELVESAYYTIKLINKDFKSLSGQFGGYSPVYPFNTEDASSVFKRYIKYIQDQTVLCVTGSGDNPLDLILNGAKKVVSFDINKNAKFFAALKFAFIKSGLSFIEFKKFFHSFHYNKPILDVKVYQSIAKHLPDFARIHWDQVFAYLEENNITIYNDESSILYTQYGFLSFPSLNATLENENSYGTEENYKKLQAILKDKNIDEIIEFVDAPLFAIEKSLHDKFSFMYLSNIIDFTSEFIKQDSLEDRLKIFKEYIQNFLSEFSLENGLIVVGFINHYKSLSEDVYYRYYEYKDIFTENECFFVDDLYPQNCKDHTILFCNKSLVKEIKQLMYDSIDYY